MYTIIMKKELCGINMTVHYNFGDDDICMTYHATDCGMRPETLEYVAHRTAYALIQWLMRVAGYEVWIDTRAQTEGGFYEAMLTQELHQY